MSEQDQRLSPDDLKLEVEADPEKSHALRDEDKYAMSIILRTNISQFALQKTGITLLPLDIDRFEKIVKKTRESLGDNLPTPKKCSEAFAGLLSEFKKHQTNFLDLNRDDTDTFWIFSRFFKGMKDADIEYLIKELPLLYGKVFRRREPNHAGKKI